MNKVRILHANNTTDLENRVDGYLKVIDKDSDYSVKDIQYQDNQHSCSVMIWYEDKDEE